MSIFVIETESEKEIKEQVWQRMGRKIGRKLERLILSAEKWHEELDIQKSENGVVAESASHSKIQLEEPEEESQLSSLTHLLMEHGKQ